MSSVTALKVKGLEKKGNGKTTLTIGDFANDGTIQETDISEALMGVKAHVMVSYMINKLGIEEDQVPVMCAQLYKEYGATMAGLKAIGYDLDYDDYHSFVHGILPYEWLKPDHTLRNLLHSLPSRKVIFSNANEAHVAKVLQRLGLEDCFDDIVYFETLNPKVEVPKNDSKELPKTPVVCKPHENSFVQAFKIAEINSHKTMFFDDSICNL